LLTQVPLPRSRFLNDKIDWNSRLLGIVGGRGTGKTTLLLQPGLLSGFLPSETGYRLVRKPSKIYMENTNLLRAVAGEIGGKDQTGIVRETFFAHQLKNAGMNVRIPSRGDFMVDGKYLFEIGGRTKGKSQIKDTDNAFVVRDDIEVGFGNVIPLWLLGFLY